MKYSIILILFIFLGCRLKYDLYGTYKSINNSAVGSLVLELDKNNKFNMVMNIGLSSDSIYGIYEKFGETLNFISKTKERDVLVYDEIFRPNYGRWKTLLFRQSDNACLLASKPVLFCKDSIINFEYNKRVKVKCDCEILFSIEGEIVDLPNLNCGNHYVLTIINRSKIIPDSFNIDLSSRKINCLNFYLKKNLAIKTQKAKKG